MLTKFSALAVNNSTCFNNRRKVISVCYKCLGSQVQESVKDVADVKYIPKPTRVKSLKKFQDPFPKSLFSGKCDPDILEFPEVLENEDIDSLKLFASNVNQFIRNEIDSSKIESTCSIPLSVIQKLGDLQVLGIKVPFDHGGYASTDTAKTLICESAGIDSSIAKFIIEGHHICAGFLRLYGDVECKRRYLEPLVRGDLIIACAYSERANLSDTTTPMATIALNEGNGNYSISGIKNGVYNASIADYLIVFAAHPKVEESGQRVRSLTAFIVPRNDPNVTVLPPAKTPGAKGVPISQVNFKDVKVTTENILGKPHEGLDMMMQIISNKFDIAPFIVGAVKEIMNETTRECIGRNFIDQPLCEMEFIRSILGRMTCAIYALESATYFHAGIIDTYEPYEDIMDKSILKVLAAETLDFVVKEAAQILGAQACSKPEFEFIDRYIRDSYYYSSSDESNLMLKISLSLGGLQHAGLVLHDEVKKIRNPFMFPKFIIKRLFELRNRISDNPSLKLGLAGYLHPSLEGSATILEYCISRIHLSSEILLSRHGKEVVNKHLDLELLADMTIKTYALTAVLARASRSYCIGLAESEAEMEVATTYANDCSRSIKRLFQDLVEGPILNNTSKFVRVSDRMLFNKKYCFESPITRNF